MGTRVRLLRNWRLPASFFSFREKIMGFKDILKEKPLFLFGRKSVLL